MDWQLFSPVKADWYRQWLAIPYKGKTVVLHGLSAPDVEDLLVQLFSVSAPETSPVSELPPEIMALLSDFPEVTSPPASLPPK